MSLALYWTVNKDLTKKDIRFIKQTVNDTNKTPTDKSAKYQYIKKLITDNGGNEKEIFSRDQVMDFFKSLHDKKELEEAWKEEYTKEWQDTTWEQPVFGDTVHKQIFNTFTGKDTPQNWQQQIKSYKKTDRQKQIAKLERELEQKRRELVKLRQEEQE